jgi:hypothetical protein
MSIIMKIIMFWYVTSYCLVDIFTKASVKYSFRETPYSPANIFVHKIIIVK